MNRHIAIDRDQAFTLQSNVIMKIICVGRNYAEHIAELGNARPEEVVLFLKPDSALMRKRDAFYIPSWTKEVHYELELVVRIDRLGKQIESRFAHKYWNQISVGIDFTARDVQQRLKSAGLPWEKSKAFDQSAAVGTWMNKAELDLKSLQFRLYKNNELVQEGDPSLMIHGIPELIAESSRYFTLKIGDLLFTGTPKGVGKVEAGDELKAEINGRQLLRVQIK